MGQSRQERLRGCTDEARARLVAARADNERRRDQPPRPGDLYVLGETAEFEVQWAVLERQEERFLVVAADQNPLVGSSDVATADDAPCGDLTLRCFFYAWLEASAFDPDMRSGFLSPEDLARAQRKRAEIDRGAVHGSALERETDTEPEYRDCEHSLAKAQAALPHQICLNGIQADTGKYLLPPVVLSQTAAWARDERIDPGILRLLEHAHLSQQPHLGLPSGVEPRDLKRAGWGLVCHATEAPAVRDALAPLVEHRRRQAGDMAQVLEYHEGDDWREWLARHGVSAGEVRPDKVPYYLLLVGSPTKIPYEFQTVLGVQHATGRVVFDTPDEYRRYVDSLIDYETAAGVPQSKKAVFFGPRHRRDPVTRLTADLLVKPLMEAAAGKYGFATTRLLGDDATKTRLAGALHGPRNRHTRSPALIFSAAHGLGWPRGYTEQATEQGALVCQDWPGRGGVSRDHVFAAADVEADAHVHGTIAFLFASYGAGTPERDHFLHEPGEPPPRIADRPFVARLPQRLLAHPQGGALAVVGLIDRAWGYAMASTAAEPLEPFQETVGSLLEGLPVGHAVQAFNERYTAVSIDLNKMLERMGFGAKISDREVASAWIERNHAQSYVVVGDPAVRLRVEAFD